MAEKHLEGDDPFEFVAVRFPVEGGIDIDAEMARCFVEEYALMGMPRERMMHIFTSKFFAGTHGILLAKGEAFIESIIDQVYGPVAAEVR
jgi:hypothetical protein